MLIMMRGWTSVLRWCAFWMKYLSIFSVTLKSAITPSFMGLTTLRLPGVRPNISLASLATAWTSPVRLSRATAEGSLITMPFSPAFFGRTPYQTSAGGLSTLYSDSRPRGPLDTLREECSRRKQRSPRLKTSRAELRAQARREHSASYERSGKKTNMRNLIGQADLGFVVLIATIAMP